jgi:hypothetical protein
MKCDALFSLEVFLFGFSILICTKVEPMSKGSDSVPLLMASLFGAKVFVEYRANLVSDFDLVATCFGERRFYCCFKVHGLCHIKNLTPLWVFPVRKRVQASESKCATLCSVLRNCL